MLTMMEWRECPGFSLYEVSDCGDVRVNITADRRNKGKRLRGSIDVDGYVHYKLYNDDGVRKAPRAHQLVALAFIGPSPGEKYEVAHNNGSRLLNTPSNLRWATRYDNSCDRTFHGTGAKGEKNAHAKITEDDVRYIRKRYAELKEIGGHMAELYDRFGINNSQVWRIARRKAWKHVI